MNILTGIISTDQIIFLQSIASLFLLSQTITFSEDGRLKQQQQQQQQQKKPGASFTQFSITMHAILLSTIPFFEQ